MTKANIQELEQAFGKIRSLLHDEVLSPPDLGIADIADEVKLFNLVGDFHDVIEGQPTEILVRLFLHFCAAIDTDAMYGQAIASELAQREARNVK